MFKQLLRAFALVALVLTSGCASVNGVITGDDREEVKLSPTASAFSAMPGFKECAEEVAQRHNVKIVGLREQMATGGIISGVTSVAGMGLAMVPGGALIPLAVSGARSLYETYGGGETDVSETVNAELMDKCVNKTPHQPVPGPDSSPSPVTTAKKK